MTHLLKGLGNLVQVVFQRFGRPLGIALIWLAIGVALALISVPGSLILTLAGVPPAWVSMLMSIPLFIAGLSGFAVLVVVVITKFLTRGPHAVARYIAGGLVLLATIALALWIIPPGKGAMVFAVITLIAIMAGFAGGYILSFVSGLAATVVLGFLVLANGNETLLDAASLRWKNIQTRITCNSHPQPETVEACKRYLREKSNRAIRSQVRTRRSEPRPTSAVIGTAHLPQGVSRGTVIGEVQYVSRCEEGCSREAKWEALRHWGDGIRTCQSTPAFLVGTNGQVRKVDTITSSGSFGCDRANEAWTARTKWPPREQPYWAAIPSEIVL